MTFIRRFEGIALSGLIFCYTQRLKACLGVGWDLFLMSM